MTKEEAWSKKDYFQKLMKVQRSWFGHPGFFKWFIILLKNRQEGREEKNKILKNVTNDKILWTNDKPVNVKDTNLLI